MKYEITIKEACNGFWNCLTPADWLQIIAVSIAALAAIASFFTVYLTRKQFKEESEDRRKKYNPFFKIQALNGSNESQYVNWFTIVNEGFPFYVISDVKWTGQGVNIKNQFNGLTVNRKNDVITNQYESLAIIFEIMNQTEELEGYIEINGMDIEHNPFTYKTPLIKISNGKITNGAHLTYQYLR
ncbi:hypothetical protein CUC43_16765 [Bacillus thuringiensis LM1212]|uniref:hypothetical protein n=1 Tax=Bacillus TaxID=1386 RepID=UPI0003FFE7D2|nr:MULTISPECIES: hypothetical protein [Bacillus]AXY08354.1 hypothetical protein CUC43_16765 [Bacillus thuringiensis LM1212]QDF26653.1 hypothetical protein FJR70_28595 [Bacillus tropicus]QUG94596.1 hypothetical protein HCM98_06465 [Bacillus tropicus]TDT85307.1 hypothetical protein DEU41_2795 [Bacillus sp. AG1163]